MMGKGRERERSRLELQRLNSNGSGAKEVITPCPNQTIDSSIELLELKIKST
jgi:hypothetical protein